MVGLALPWGVAEPSGDPAPPQSAPRSSERNLPNFGDRIEVKWMLKRDDDGPTTRWWGARVDADTGRQDVSGRQLWTIWYDAYEEFEPESAEVAFLPGGWLKDVGQEDPLRWRFEGEELDDEDELDDEEGGEEEGEGEPIDIAQLAQMETAMERVFGKPLDQVAAEQMAAAQLDAAQQLEVAARFRTFVDTVKSQLAERLAGSADGRYTVTEADVAAIVASMGRPGGGAGGAH